MLKTRALQAEASVGRQRGGGSHKGNQFEKNICYPARALRALGLLLADGAPTVGGGKTF